MKQDITRAEFLKGVSSVLLVGTAQDEAFQKLKKLNKEKTAGGTRRIALVKIGVWMNESHALVDIIQHLKDEKIVPADARVFAVQYVITENLWYVGLEHPSFSEHIPAHEGNVIASVEFNNDKMRVWVLKDAGPMRSRGGIS